jgi:peroxiredoxin
MTELGTKATSFELPDPSGKLYTLDSFRQSPVLVVMFICNHCPYVVHIREALAKLCKEYQQKNVAFVAINANDIEQYPDDRPEKMAEMAEQFSFSFPYLFDASQDVAKSYRAACTPDFFVYDQSRSLVYRGQMDASRPGNDEEPNGLDLREALDHLLEGKSSSKEQKPSLGCNIKWKKGNEPTYF